MRLRGGSPLGIGLILASSAFAAACSDESDEPDDHGTYAAECQAINDVCHVPLTPSPATDACHRYAHDNVVADCVAHRDECIAACTAQPGAGGGAGAGG